jgi:hypothetical protein
LFYIVAMRSQGKNVDGHCDFVAPPSRRLSWGRLARTSARC